MQAEEEEVKKKKQNRKERHPQCLDVGVLLAAIRPLLSRCDDLMDRQSYDPHDVTIVSNSSRVVFFAVPGRARCDFMRLHLSPNSSLEYFSFDGYHILVHPRTSVSHGPERLFYTRPMISASHMRRMKCDDTEETFNVFPIAFLGGEIHASGALTPTDNRLGVRWRRQMTALYALYHSLPSSSAASNKRSTSVYQPEAEAVITLMDMADTKRLWRHPKRQCPLPAAAGGLIARLAETDDDGPICPKLAHTYARTAGIYRAGSSGGDTETILSSSSSSPPSPLVSLESVFGTAVTPPFGPYAEHPREGDFCCHIALLCIVCTYLIFVCVAGGSGDPDGTGDGCTQSVPYDDTAAAAKEEEEETADGSDTSTCFTDDEAL